MDRIRTRKPRRHRGPDQLGRTLLVSVVTVACTVAAGASAVQLRRGWPRAAGACLLLSSVMPTFLWYPLNLATIVVGVAFIVTA